MNNINFVRLNKFCELSQPAHPTPLLLKDNIKLDGISSKIKRKVHAYFTFYFKF